MERIDWLGQTASLDWLFPRRCAVCDTLLKRGEKGCCRRCYRKLAWIKQPFCYCCGKPLEKEEQEYCVDCRKAKRSFLANRSLLLYDEVAEQSLTRFKFYNRREYALFYGRELYRAYKRELLSWQADALIPVPIHKTKFRQRGYNQAELVAQELGRQSGIPVLTDILVREVETAAQKKLNPVERLENLEKAFQISENSVKLDIVVLVDDIYTTGATLEACSRRLLAHGVQRVYGMTVAAGQGY